MIEEEEQKSFHTPYEPVFT